MDSEFYLEKLKIVERLQALESSINSLINMKKASDDYFQKIIDRHELDLYGNGRPGIKTTVDRLNQIEIGRRWTIRTLIVFVLGLISKAFFDTWSK